MMTQRPSIVGDSVGADVGAGVGSDVGEAVSSQYMSSIRFPGWSRSKHAVTVAQLPNVGASVGVIVGTLVGVSVGEGVGGIVEAPVVGALVGVSVDIGSGVGGAGVGTGVGHLFLRSMGYGVGAIVGTGEHSVLSAGGRSDKSTGLSRDERAITSQSL